jgi:hypothetical protein
MSTPNPQRRIPFSLASRGLRFRVLVGEDSGYAVTRRVGIGGAVLRASVIPAVGTHVRLLERYGSPGADAWIDAEVVGVIPEPSLDGTEPGFVAEFRAITVRGSEHHLLEFIHSLEPGYWQGRRREDALGRGDMISAATDDSRGHCTRFTPATRWALAPLFHAAGIGQQGGQDLSWDDGLEEIDLAGELGANLTPIAEQIIAIPIASVPPPPIASPEASTPAGTEPSPRRRKRGITGIFGSLFGKARETDDDTS